MLRVQRGGAATAKIREEGVSLSSAHPTPPQQKAGKSSSSLPLIQRKVPFAEVPSLIFLRDVTSHLHFVQMVLRTKTPGEK